MSKLADFIRKKHHHFCTAVVAAAGSGTRMGEDKLWLVLGGKPVLARTLEVFQQSVAVDEIIVVTRPESVDRVGALREQYGLTKLTKVVLGGETRTASVLAGCTEADPRATVLCVQDGARPFVTEEIIADAVHQAVLYGAAAPAIPVKDTVKIAADGLVRSTPDRTTLFAVQTPQAFQPELLKAALTKAATENTAFTDDCAAVEALGFPVHLSLGSEENIKLTTPADLVLAELIVRKREEKRNDP